MTGIVEFCATKRMRLSPPRGMMQWINVSSFRSAVRAARSVVGTSCTASGGNPAESASYDHAKVGIMAGTVLAAVLAAVLLRLRNRRYRRIAAEETADLDRDGVPDVYQPPSAES